MTLIFPVHFLVGLSEPTTVGQFPEIAAIAGSVLHSLLAPHSLHLITTSWQGLSLTLCLLCPAVHINSHTVPRVLRPHSFFKSNHPWPHGVGKYC